MRKNVMKRPTARLWSITGMLSIASLRHQDMIATRTSFYPGYPAPRRMRKSLTMVNAHQQPQQKQPPHQQPQAQSHKMKRPQSQPLPHQINMLMVASMTLRDDLTGRRYRPPQSVSLHRLQTEASLRGVVDRHCSQQHHADFWGGSCFVPRST